MVLVNMRVLVKKTAGQNVHLTLDLDLQKAAEKALGNKVRSRRLIPTTVLVLAMVSRQLLQIFSPSGSPLPSGGISRAKTIPLLIALSGLSASQYVQNHYNYRWH